MLENAFSAQNRNNFAIFVVYLQNRTNSMAHSTYMKEDAIRQPYQKETL